MAVRKALSEEMTIILEARVWYSTLNKDIPGREDKNKEPSQKRTWHVLVSAKRQMKHIEQKKVSMGYEEKDSYKPDHERSYRTRVDLLYK